MMTVAVVVVAEGLHSFLMVVSMRAAVTDIVDGTVLLRQLSSTVAASEVMAVVLACGAIEFASESMAVSSSGNGIVDVAVVAAGDDALRAVITAFTAAIFKFKSNVFSRCFFFWECFPRPGPGILSHECDVLAKKETDRLVLVLGLVLCDWFTGKLLD
jgi:hypothetical protein